MQTFKYGTPVKIHSTASKELDGVIAKICGITSSHPECTFYIIELPFINERGYTHISLSDACLKLN